MTLLFWLAIWLQLADPRETEFGPELFLDRLRLLHDAPPIQDVDRLPPLVLARHNAGFASEHMNWLLQRWSMDPDGYGPWLTEHRQYVQFWTEVNWAHMEHIPITSRRGSLKEIRRMVGDQAWFAMDWPGPAPVWRFAECR